MALIKKIIKVDDKKQAQTAQIAKKIIQDSNKIKEKLSLTILGDDNCTQWPCNYHQ